MGRVLPHSLLGPGHLFYLVLISIMPIPRAHLIEFEINNFTEEDDEDIQNLISLPNVDFYAFAYEGVFNDKYQPHIHGMVHFKNQVSISLSRYFRRQPHTAVVKDPEAYMLYIAGYEKGELKVPEDGPNVVITEGELPVNGKHKVNPTNLVMTALQEGHIYDELREMFPSYMLFHGAKVKQWIEESKGKLPTRFYVINPIHDAITEVTEYFQLAEDEDIPEGDPKMAVVTDMTQLEAFINYDYVLFYAEYHDKLQDLWPRGVPITYKYGFQQKVVKCRYFVIITNDVKKYPLYKNIN